MRRLATRIIELERGQLTSWPGDYDEYRKNREQMLAAELKQESEQDKKLAAEESMDTPGHQGQANTQRRARQGTGGTAPATAGTA